MIAPYSKMYCCVTYLLSVSIYLLWAVDIFNHFNCSSLQFTIVVLAWNYFTSYAIVLPMSLYAHVFQPGRTCFRCKLLRYICCYFCIRFPMTLLIMYWDLKLFSQLISDMFIVSMYILILDIYCSVSLLINSLYAT